jgi:deoxyadenosine/deoxycytidine kinase
MERIKARGRSFESGYTLEYLQSITDRLGEYAESLANIPETTLLTFDSEKYDITKPSGQKALLSLINTHL